jgi:hypothetical protein
MPATENTPFSTFRGRVADHEVTWALATLLRWQEPLQGHTRPRASNSKQARYWNSIVLQPRAVDDHHAKFIERSVGAYPVEQITRWVALFLVVGKQHPNVCRRTLRTNRSGYAAAATAGVACGGAGVEVLEESMRKMTSRLGLCE